MRPIAPFERARSGVLTLEIAPDSGCPAAHWPLFQGLTAFVHPAYLGESLAVETTPSTLREGPASDCPCTCRKAYEPREGSSTPRCSTVLLANRASLAESVAVASTDIKSCAPRWVAVCQASLPGSLGHWLSGDQASVKAVGSLCRGDHNFYRRARLSRRGRDASLARHLVCRRTAAARSAGAGFFAAHR